MITIDDYDRISRAYAEARALAVEIKSVKDLIQGLSWLDSTCKAEILASLKDCANRKKKDVIDVINTAVTP